MLALTILGLLLLTTFQLVTGDTAIPDSLIDRSGYEVVDLQFKGTIGPYEVQLNGTIQQIVAQMKVLYPDFDVDEYLSTPNNDTLIERDALNKNGLICIPVPGQDWVVCDSKSISGGVIYLSRIAGGCHLAGKKCSRISCSYSSAIWFCNDNDYDIAPNCAYLGSYAKDIWTSCEFNYPQDPQNWWTGGQKFDSDKYNIIVRYDDTDGCKH